MSLTKRYDEYKTHFCEVLRVLCESKGSINHVCAEIGINRQQFAKYMSGANLPSTFVIQRFADYFKVSPSRFFLVDGKSAEEHPDVTKSILVHNISGYYLEYTSCWLEFEAHVLVGAWRFHVQGSRLNTHGELPSSIASPKRKIFERFKGVISEIDNIVMMSASSDLQHGGARKQTLWFLRPYAYGPKDFISMKIQTENSDFRPLTSAVSYFRFIGQEPDLPQVLANDCGVFDHSQLNNRAASIIKIITSRSRVEESQLCIE